MEDRGYSFGLDELGGNAARFAEQLCAASPSLAPSMQLKLDGVTHLSDFASVVTHSPDAALPANKRSSPDGATSSASKRARPAGLPTTPLPPKLVPRLKLEAVDASSMLESSRDTSVKSHTRRCREKVNEKFKRLLEALPPPPEGVEVKHKAQILEYTIRVFRHYIARRSALRTDIALASSSALARWAAERAAQPLPALLDAFGALYARKHSWKYAEVWAPQGPALALAFASVCGPAAPQLGAFAARARELPPPPPGARGLVQRAAAAQRAEWLPAPRDDPAAFARAGLAAQAGIEVALAVPVRTRDGGPTPVAVLLFADVEERAYSTADVAALSDFANLVADTHASFVTDNSPMQPAPPPVTTDLPAYDAPTLSFDVNASPPLTTHAFADFAFPPADLSGMCM